MNCILKNTLGIVVLVVSLCSVSIYSMDIFHAAKTGNIDRVRELIAAGANVNQQDNNGLTPLHWAAENGHQAVVQALIAAGADINQQDNDGWTPLLHAAGWDGHQAVSPSSYCCRCRFQSAR